jgi:DNA-binding MarR family transcriptional regulator
MITACNNIKMKAITTRHDSVAFLLTQLGTHAARRFTERLAPLNLAPQHVGILRILNQAESQSQRQLATTLNMHASRLVALIDELEALGLVARQANGNDRRTYTLRITEKGGETLAKVGQIGHAHNNAICEALNAEEREQLALLLQRIAEEQGLVRGIHPGYSQLGKSEETAAQLSSGGKDPE